MREAIKNPKLLLLSVAALLIAAMVAMGSYKAIRKAQARAAEEAMEQEIAEIIATGTSLGEATEADSEADEHFATDMMVNKLLPDVAFADVSGASATLSDYRGDVLVISMTSIGCPISKKVMPALSRLPEAHSEENVKFLLLNVDPDPSEDEVKAHAKHFPGWRYVHKANAELARVLAARTTTEVFVIDEAQTLRYRGAIDERFDVGVVREGGGAEYLNDALSSIVGDRLVAEQVTPAPGCILGLETDETADIPVTWHNQVSRFVQSNCLECHRAGEAAPFALETYEQVLAKKSMIEYVLEDGIMPPWFADPAHGDWRNARIVSDADKKMFSEWIKAGTPKGESEDAPVQLSWGSGWSIGEPDIEISVAPQEIPAEGLIEWRKFALDFEVTEDLWVSAAEIRPSVREVVHHAMLFVDYADDDPRGLGQPKAESAESEGGGGYWLSYFPGRKSMQLPPGRAKLIPKGGHIYIQLHYTANGTEHIDNPRVGLKLIDGPPERQVISGGLGKGGGLMIPPNSRVQFSAGRVLAEDIQLLALMPHMHARGAGSQVFVKHADGRVEFLLDVPTYDFDWQLSYEFREPVLVTKGSTIVIQHDYDNTQANPNNPDPTQVVRGGWSTNDEMMINFFEWEPVGEAPPIGTSNRPFL